MKTLDKQIEFGYLEVVIRTDKYFSVTGNVYKDKAAFTNGNDNAITCCGCIHDIILDAFPELQHLVDLHLSDLNGMPMHALDNGWYYYQIMRGVAKYHTKEKGDWAKYYKVLRQHLRVSEYGLNKMIESWEKADTEESKKIAFTVSLNGLQRKWRRQAETALEMIEKL